MNREEANKEEELRLINALQFAKVQVSDGPWRGSGYLSGVSARMLLAVLDNWGYKIEKKNG